MIREFRLHWMWLALAGISSLLVAAPLNAGFLTSNTGNSQLSDSASSDGIVNFAVYQNTGGSGDWVTDLGLAGIALFLDGLDTSAQYVLFYQLVNTNPVGTADPSLTTLRVSTGGSAYTALGYLNNRVFTDSDGEKVGAIGNRFLGTEGPKPDDVVDGTPSESGVALAALPFAFQGSARNPLTGERDAGLGPDSFASWLWPAGSLAGPVTPNGFSTVVFVTTNNAILSGGKSEIQDGAVPSDGDAPMQSAVQAELPEPASLIVWGLGVGLAGFVVVAQRRRKQATLLRQQSLPCSA